MGDPLKTLGSFLQPVVGFDLAYALQMIHEKGIESRRGFSLDAVARMGGEGVIKGAGGQKGNRSQRPRRQLGIEAKKNQADPDELDEGYQPLLNAVDEHAFHVHHVFADPGEQVAAGPMVIPRDGKFLESPI